MLSWMTSLGDLTRARILRLLERHELTVAELCAVLQLPQSTVSRHLKVLADDHWLTTRREGTSRIYRMSPGELDPAARRLWLLVREQTADTPASQHDERRLASVLAERQSRSQAFFSSAAGQWDRLRSELFGDRFDLLALAGLLDQTWTVGDLGCGTGQTTESLAPFIKRVIAVDDSPVMLRNASKRLAHVANIDLRRGSLTALPINDGELDAAVIMLVLHHIASPPEVFKEAHRVLKPGGKLLIVDMLRHDRIEFQQQMGHVWLGFTADELNAWLTAASFRGPRITPMPVPPNAKGPALFTATATCP
jgi:ArsR family transcriptional regulator